MGKSAAIATATELLEILKRSQLVSAEQITAHEEAAQGASDAKAAARIFVKAKLLSPWQVMQLLAGRHNLRLGPYTLREQTKKGSQGAMFLAEHTQLNRLATIKILRDEHSLDAARKAFGVDHPHLLRVLDVDQKGERYYVAIEHVAGPTLQEHVANQKLLPVKEAVTWLRQAASGLVHIHANNLVHGGIQPTVLLVDKQETLKIADLGMTGAAAATVSSEAKPSVYLAPEQLQDAPLTAAADIYALGATFYFLLTGKAPFQQLEKTELVAAKQQGPSKKILDRRADLPPALVKICDRMMAPQADERFANVAAVEGILGDWLEQNHQEQDQESGEPETMRENSAAADVANAPVVSTEFPGINTESSPTPVKQSKAAGVRIATSRPARTEQKAKKETTKDDRTGLSPNQNGNTKKIPLGIVISAVCSVLLILVLLVALVVFVFFPGSSDRALAQTNPSELDTPNTETGNAAVSDLESDPEPETEPVDHTRDRVATGPPASPQDSTAGTATLPAAKPMTTTGIGGGLNAAVPADKAPPATDVAVNTESATPETLPKPAEPAAAEPPPAKPEPAAPAAPEPPTAKPEPAQPAAPPTAPAGKPFRDLAAQVDLPPLDPQQAPAKTATPLGPVHLGPQQVCFIRLLGGRSALRGKQQFKMANADDGRAEREWELSLAASDADKGKVVALLALADGNLTFQWTAEAAQQRGAANLRNCLLSMSAGEDVIQLGLRKPIQIEAPEFNLKKQTLALKWDLPDYPDPAAMKVEFTGLDGNFPEFKWDPETGQAQANKGQALIRFTKAHTGLEIELATALKRNQFELGLRPWVKPPQGRRIPLNIKTLQQAQQAAVNGQRAASVAIAQSGELKKKNKELGAQRENLAKQALERAKKTFAQVQAFDKVFQEGSGKLQFRVIYRTDQHQIELLRTSGAKAADG